MILASTEMKPGDRVIWVRSPGRSILETWKVERIPGVVVRICRRRVRIRVCRGGTEKLASVDPENLIRDDGSSEFISRLDNSA